MKRFPNFFYDLSCGDQYSLLIQTLLAKYKGIDLDGSLVNDICNDYSELMTIYNEECFFGCLPIEEMEMIPDRLLFSRSYKTFINKFNFQINVKSQLMNEQQFIAYLESVKEVADVKKRIQKLWT